MGDDGKEYCYVFDTRDGYTIKSPVRSFGGEVLTPRNPVFPLFDGNGAGPRNIATLPTFPTGGGTKIISTEGTTTKLDPAGEMETKEQREARLSRNKVPPAFLGDIRRMHLDPSKNDGRSDITPHM